MISQLKVIDSFPIFKISTTRQEKGGIYDRKQVYPKIVQT